MSTSAPARRAVVRWAVRLFRRDWRQQAMVLALSTVAVAASLAGAIVIVNATSTARGDLGTADARIQVDASEDLASAVELARQRLGAVEVVAHAPVARPASAEPLDVRDQSPSGPYGGSTVALRSGRYPTAAGEVALTAGAAADLDATVGADVSLGRTTARVVGLVENPGDLRNDFALVAPGTLDAPAWHTLLVALPEEGPAALHGIPGRIEVDGRGPSRPAIEAGVIGAVTLAMALVGLVAATGFVVVAQRRQRQLGLLAAIGAGDRHVRLVMVANGVLVGLVSAVVGGLLGIGTWLLAAPLVEEAANHRIDRFDLPWTVVVAVLVLAVVAATVAAWWPARAAARVPVMAALSGRPAPPRPVHRSLLVAVLLVVAGVAGIYAARPRTEEVNPLLLIACVLAVVIGAVFAAPAAVRTLGALARRLPFAPRLALRDLARYQARAAAAVAAMALGLGISVSIIGIAAASEPRSSTVNLSDRELLIQPLPGVTAADLDDEAAAVAAALGEGHQAVPLDVAVAPGAARPVLVGRSLGPHDLELVGLAYVATPEVLALYGIDPATIPAETELLTSRGHGLVITKAGPEPALGSESVTLAAPLPPYEAAPNTLIMPAVVAERGWTTVRAAWIVEAPAPLTEAQRAAARTAAGAGDLVIEARNLDASSTLRNGVAVVGGAVAMAIVAMAVGLIRGESARDLRTLTATGAAPRTRRAITASTAGALAVLGVVLGFASAYAALLAVYRDELELLLPLPLSSLLVLGVGLPVAAIVGGWALAGREPRGFARQQLD